MIAPTASLIQEVIEKDPLLYFALVYGAANSGKSRLATSLPERFGKIAYIALDPGAANLGSILPAYHERIRPFKIDTSEPFVAAGAIALTDWKGEYGCDTLVIDTYTTLVWKQLLYGARSGVFNTKQDGPPKGVGIPGTANYAVIPSQRDYGGVQGAVSAFLSMVQENQTNVNVIFVCHEALKESATGGSVGGPRLAGKALTDWFPGQFTLTVRLDRKVTQTAKKGGGLLKTTKHIARVANHGAWIAGFKENDERGTQLTEVDLDTDPINFWEDLDAVSASVFNKEEK